MTLAIGKENAQRKNVCSPSIKKWEVSPLPVKLAVVRFVLLVILKLFLNWLQAEQTDESTLLTQTASSTEIEVYKKRLNQLTLSPSFNHQLSSTFLPFSNFASRLLRLLFSHPPPPPNFSISLAFFLSASAVPRGYETVLETCCMCHGLSCRDGDTLMVRGLFIPFAGLYNTDTQQQQHIHTVCTYTQTLISYGVNCKIFPSPPPHVYK